MKQINVTPAMGKRLIGLGMAVHPEIEKVLEKGTLVIIAGTTNGYVSEEILKKLDLADDFSREGYRRGTTMGAAPRIKEAEFPGDVVITDGKWRKGATIFDVAEDLVSEIDRIRKTIGVDRGALIKVWLHERVQQEKAASTN